MVRRNFELSLNRILESRTVEKLCEDAPNPQGTAGGNGGPDPSQQDPKLKQQQKEAERQGANKAGAAGAPQGAAGSQPDPKAATQDAKAQQDKQKQAQQSTQLSTQMAEFDKQVAQLQAKIQSGAAKPTEINKLNQILTAKKAVQDKFMRLFGVNPTG